MRGRTVFMKVSALCGERMTRSSVWQLTQLRNTFFCASVPGTLVIHSPLESCAARSFALASLRSAVAIFPFAIFAETALSSSKPTARTFSA
jgi:hypothetical protein